MRRLWTNRYVQRFRHSINPADVYYVTDGANWSFDWDAHYITQGLIQCGVDAKVTQSINGLKNTIIHYGNRYAYLAGEAERVDSSNIVIMTWFHGSPDSDVMKPIFEKLLHYVSNLHVILTSCETSRRNLNISGVSDSKIVVIPLGIDNSSFASTTLDGRLLAKRNLGIPETAFCIGSFQKDGNGWEDGLEPKLIKGPDIFLEVLARLSSINDDLFVLLTGPARGFVKNGLDRLKIPYTHHYVEHYQDLSSYYHALDAYLICSRDEGGPKSILESWATGVPVVSTRMGMPADLVRQGENGLLAEIDDVQGLADHVQTLIEDEALRTRIIERALEDAQAFSWSRIAEQYYRQLYLPLLNR